MIQKYKKRRKGSLGKTLMRAFSDYLSTLLFYSFLTLYTMASKTYKFKLIDSKQPVIKGKNIITDSNVGGVKNTYKIFELRYFLINIEFLQYWKYIGTKSFLRPYQSIWDKDTHRLQPVYWGKGPLLNMWLVLSNDYDNIKHVKALLPEDDTRRHCTKIFNRDFKSHELVKNLKSNESFYQSKFVKS